MLKMFKYVGNIILSSIALRKQQEQNFFVAILAGDFPTITALIKKFKFNPNTLDDDSLSALHILAEKGDNYVAKFLLSHKEVDVNVHIGARNGDTPLMTSIIFSRIQFMQLLLKHGADPNIPNNFGNTPLHNAVRKRNIEMVKILIFSKALPNVEDSFGNTPLSLSIIEYPSKEIAQMLLKKCGANPNFRIIKPQPLLIELALNCQSKEYLDMVKLLLDFKAKINVIDEISWQTPLHIASITGYVPLAKFLLENGANPELKDHSGRTPFQIAEDHQANDLIRFYKKRLVRIKDILVVKNAAQKLLSKKRNASQKLRNVRFDSEGTEEEEENTNNKLD